MCKFSAQHCSSRKEKDSSGVVALECKPAEKGEQCVKKVRAVIHT